MQTWKRSQTGPQRSRPTLHEIWLARVDKTRPVVVLTRSAVLPFLQRITVAPITSTVRGLMTEVPVARSNGVDHAGVISCDNIATIPRSSLVRRLGALHAHQEQELAAAIRYAFDLERDDIP